MVIAIDQVKHESGEPLTDEPGNPRNGMGGSSSTQNSEPTNESQSAKLQKDAAMDVLVERTSSHSKGDAATCATERVANTGTELSSTMKKESASTEKGSDQKKDSPIGDLDFEKGSKLSRDSPAAEHHSKAGSSQRRESGTAAESSSDVDKYHTRESSGTDGQPSRGQGSTRDFEPAWETKPQRYTLRRAASQISEGAVESPQVWANRGTFPGKVSRDQQGRGPVFHPRIPYVNPVSGFGVAPRPPLRAAERGRVVPVVPPLQVGAGLPGLLGAAPSPVFGDRGIPGDRRFDTMGPPEVSRGYSHSPIDHRGPRSIRGSLYNDRVVAGPRGPSDFPGEGSYSSASNGLGTSWDDHFQGDGRPRNR